MELDEKYMLEAMREARLALDEGEIPIGAVVVFKGRVCTIIGLPMPDVPEVSPSVSENFATVCVVTSFEGIT